MTNPDYIFPALVGLLLLNGGILATQIIQLYLPVATKAKEAKAHKERIQQIECDRQERRERRREGPILET